MSLHLNSSSVCLGLSLLGGLAVPGAASAVEELDRSLAHYEALQRSMCMQDSALAARHAQYLVTPSTLPAYRYNNPVILMTPRCQMGMVVAISPRGELRRQTMGEAFYLPVEVSQAESAGVETVPVAVAPPSQAGYTAAAIAPPPEQPQVRPESPTIAASTPPRPQVRVVQVQAEAIALNSPVPEASDGGGAAPLVLADVQTSPEYRQIRAAAWD